MEDSKKDYQRFDEPPYSLGLMACGINALIEGLKLNVEKLPKDNIRMSEAGLKLYELSIVNRRQVMNLAGQGQQLQEIIESRCLDESKIQKVFKLTELKYQHLRNTGTLI